MQDTIVETKYGKVKGERLGNVTAWKGIPFARPPLGLLRFHPPQPPDPWKGIRQAARFGPSAIQAKLPFFGVHETREDCLYLNIWSPAADDALRPVMVWIHGGAFAIGSGSQELYDGASFAERGDMVVVTINYRLGALGFLYLGALAGEGFASSGNCGLLDQVAALQWVQENIRAFGGDPSQVTVAGESAGAISIANLLAMPLARGLFHRAILESMAAPVIRLDRAARVANHLLDCLHLQPSKLTSLWELSTRQLLAASKDFAWGSFWPVVDGVIISRPPEELLREGCAGNIPVLIGSNRDEYQLFAALDPTYVMWDEAEVLRRLENVFGSFWPEIARRLPGTSPDKACFNRIMSYYVLVYPTLKFSEILSAHAPVWAYQFAFRHPLLGAAHGFELPFAWNNLQKMPMLSMDSPEGRELAGRMHGAWIAFIRGGDPNVAGLPTWPRFDLQQRPVMVFDSQCRVEPDPYPDRRLWEELSALEAYRPTTERDIDLAGKTRFVTRDGQGAAPG